jgi:hypothetical protein
MLQWRKKRELWTFSVILIWSIISCPVRCLLSIGNWVLYKRGLDSDNSFLRFIIKFIKENNLFNFISCNFFFADATIFSYFLKISFPPKHKKLPSKVAHNPNRPTVFSPTSFWFVQLRQFYSLNVSSVWSCQTLQYEKIA